MKKGRAGTMTHDYKRHAARVFCRSEPRQMAQATIEIGLPVQKLAAAKKLPK